jgi:hypothetical protein
MQYKHIANQLLTVIITNAVLLKDLAQPYLVVDKTALILRLMYAVALIGLYMTKLFNLIFTLILALPDKMIYVTHTRSTDNGKIIRILNAFNEHGDVTNKMKLFLSWYWEHGGADKAHETSGFDFKKIAKMLKCSVVYFSFIMCDKASPSADALKEIHRYILEIDKNNKCYAYRNGVYTVQNRQELAYGHFDFDDNVEDEATDLTTVDEEKKSVVQSIIEKFEKKVD